MAVALLHGQTFLGGQDLGKHTPFPRLYTSAIVWALVRRKKVKGLVKGLVKDIVKGFTIAKACFCMGKELYDT